MTPRSSSKTRKGKEPTKDNNKASTKDETKESKSEHSNTKKQPPAQANDKQKNQTAKSIAKTSNPSTRALRARDTKPKPEKSTNKNGINNGKNGKSTM